MTRELKRVSNKVGKYVYKKVNLGCPTTERRIYETYEGIADPEVRDALYELEGAMNRYNFLDLRDPNVENVHYLAIEVAYAKVQLALAKARLRTGKDITINYQSFDSIFRGREAAKKALVEGGILNWKSA